MKIDGKSYKTIWFENNLVKIIDQTKLPHKFVIKDLKTEGHDVIVADAGNLFFKIFTKEISLSSAADDLDIALNKKKENLSNSDLFLDIIQ